MVVATALAGCTTDVTLSSARVAEPGHNSADVAFAAEMVPHHEQGLEMVDLTGRREVSGAFTDLTRQIAAEQSADIDEMESWLAAWDEEAAPPTDRMMDDETLSTRSSAGAMRGMMRSRMGPWALGTEDLDALVASPSARFEDRWLRTMITHHQGAISMARHEISHGAYPPAITLAEHVVTTQQAEIEQMRQLLRD